MLSLLGWVIPFALTHLGTIGSVVSAVGAGSGLLSHLPGFAQVKWILLAVAAVGIAAGSAALMHRFDAGQVLAVQHAFDTYKLEAAANALKAQQSAAAKQKAQDSVALQAAVEEASAQTKIEVQTRTLIKEVPRYVKVNPSACVTFGFVRAIDAAALGVDPADLPLAPGKSDDTCTDITAVALAQNIAWNYANVANANARQLNDLEATVRRLTAAANNN